MYAVVSLVSNYGSAIAELLGINAKGSLRAE